MFSNYDAFLKFVILGQFFTDLVDQLKQYQIEIKVKTEEKIDNNVLEIAESTI